MPRSNRATPYKRPSTVTPTSSQGSGSPLQPAPHELPNSRIQLMLNRSRGSSFQQPTGSTNPNQNASAHNPITDDDLGLFNGDDDPNGESNGPDTNGDDTAMDNGDETPSPAPPQQTWAIPTGSNNVTSNVTSTSPTHLTGTKLQCFNRLATRAHLHEDCQIFGRSLCNFASGEDAFFSCLITVLSVRQDLMSTREELLEAIARIPASRQGSSSAEVVTWKADGAELKQSMRLLATQCILGGDVQAYTARVDTMGEPDLLPLSLYAKVMSAMLSNPTEWKNRVLPPGYGINPDPRHTRSLQTTMNVVLKEVRKSFDDVLLTNINLPHRVQPACNSNVPVLDTVIVKLYQKERGLIGGRVRVREEILEEVDQLRTSRYAWLRMQSIHWGLNLAEYEGRSFWKVVDRQLEHLRSQTRRYRYAFFLLVLQFDMERIDGTKNFEQLKATTDFSLPTEVQIQETMDELDATFGEEIQPDEEAHNAAPDEAI